MHDDFGYIEEGQLGKPYNLKLLKRLSGYVIPYKKIIFICLFLAILVTLLDLTLPYLTKIAIDRYILASWYTVDISGLNRTESESFLKKYKPLLEKSKQPSLFLIQHERMKKIDPVDLREYRQKGIISQEPFYLVPSGIIGEPLKAQMTNGPMTNEGILITYDEIKKYPVEIILNIRAKDVRGLSFVALILLLMLFLSFGLGYWEYYLLEFIGQNIMQDIRLELYQRIQSRAIRFFEKHPVGRLVTRVTNDVENLNEMFKSVLVTLFKDFFILVSILSLLLYMNWQLALVSFAILPFIFGITILFSSLMREAFRQLREKVSKLNVFQQERFSGMRIIQLFAREEFQMKSFKQLNHENYLAGIKQLRLFAVFVPIMELLASFAIALIIWYGGGKVIADRLSLGSLVAFISYIQMFFRPIRDISEKYNIMQLAMASTERIFEFMDNGEEMPKPDIPVQSPHTDGKLEFKNVSFSYKKGNPVLKNISFEIKPGEMIAVVGATGAGKTTLVNLIERFYDPEEGSIILDGTDIRRMKKQDLRSRIGLVMQDVFIFSGSVRENITLGDDKIDPQVISDAIEKANAEWFIRKLSKGLDQIISEGGSTLSGGERQLLSFARTLAYNPKILILDEATSNVDPETERLIQEAIAVMTRKRTTLVIAHRLSTIHNADRIMVMHHGRIEEQGNHEELMKAHGIYYKLNRFREYD